MLNFVLGATGHDRPIGRLDSSQLYCVSINVCPFSISTVLLKIGHSIGDIQYDIQEGVKKD